MENIYIDKTELEHEITQRKISFCIIENGSEVRKELSIKDVIEIIIEKGEDFELVDASFLDLDENNPMQNENPNLLVDGVIDDHVGFADIDFNSPAFIYFTNPVLMILGYGFVKYEGDIQKALYILNEEDDLLLNKPRQIVDVSNSSWKTRKLMKDNNNAINKWLDKG